MMPMNVFPLDLLSRCAAARTAPGAPPGATAPYACTKPVASDSRGPSITKRRNPPRPTSPSAMRNTARTACQPNRSAHLHGSGEDQNRIVQLWPQKRNKSPLSAKTKTEMEGCARRRLWAVSAAEVGLFPGPRVQGGGNNACTRPLSRRCGRCQMCEASSTFLFDFGFLGSVTRVSASDFHVQRSDQEAPALWP